MSKANVCKHERINFKSILLLHLFRNTCKYEVSTISKQNFCRHKNYNISNIVCDSFLPESFRWLIARDRSKDAKRIVKQISKWNKRPVPDYDRIIRAFSDHHKEKSENYSLLVLFRKLPLLKLTVPLIIGW